MKLRKLAKLCIHDRMEEHYGFHIEGFVCPGGVFLPDDTLIIEKVDIDPVALAATLARFNNTLDLAALDPDRVSNETEWSAYEADVERLIEPAQLILDALSVREAE